MAGVVRVKIIGDASDLEGTIQKSSGLFAGLGGAAKSVLGGVGLAIGQQAAQLLGGLPGQLLGVAQGASELADQLSAVGVVFGQDQMGRLESWAEGADKAMGASKGLALQAAQTFGTFGKSAGLSGAQLTDFSTELGQLGGDLASFHGGSTQEAIEAIGSALRGEAEPMRRYGVLLDDATLRQKALEMGLVSTTKEALDPQTKILAAHALIMEKTTDAQGDFARTADGAANKSRTLSAQFQNLKDKVGTALLPVFTAVVTFLSDRLIPWVERLGPSIQAGIGAAVPVLQSLGQAIAQVAAWFQEHSEVTIAVVAGLGAILLAFFVSWAVSAGAAAVATLAAIAPILLIGAAIAGLVAIFVYAYRNFDWFRTGVDAVVGAVVTAFNWMADAVGGIINWISDRWSQWGDEITSIIRWAFDFISNYITTYLGIIRNTIGFFINLFTGDWSGAWNSLQGIFWSAWNGIWNAISLAFQGLLAWNRWLWDLGRNLIQSLINGVSSMAGALKDKVTGIAGDALGAIGGVFGIGSPSKVMIQYGRWVMEGLMIGEEQGMKRMGGLLGPLGLPGGLGGGHSPAAGMAASGAPVVQVGGQAVTDRDLVILVKDGLREFDRERR